MIGEGIGESEMNIGVNLTTAVTLGGVYNGGGASPGSRDLSQWAVGGTGCSCKSQRSQHNVGLPS